MYLNLIVQHTQDIVDVSLPWLRSFTDPLKLNEERSTAWNEEETVWPPIVAFQIQLDRGYPHLLEGNLADLVFSVCFKFKHHFINRTSFFSSIRLSTAA